MNIVYTLILIFGTANLDSHGHVMGDYRTETYSQDFTTMQMCRKEETRQVNLRKYKLKQKVYDHKCIAVK